MVSRSTTASADPARLPLRALRAAEAVARLGSAAQAAAALQLSVSAVSRAVQQAEALLGLPLFERGARGMAATPAGQTLLLRVRRAQAELVQAGGVVLAARATETMLQALEAIAATRSESTAGLRLGLTQAAVHQSLKQLEHAARTVLFQRSHRGTRLTEAGERMLLHAPAVGLQVNSPAVARSVLMAGDQVALLSALQIQGELHSGLLTVLPVPLQGTERPIGVMRRRDGLPSPVLLALLVELRAVAVHATARS